MRNKMGSIIVLIIILCLMSSSIVYAYIQIIQYNTMEIQNVNDESNIYVLLRDIVFSEIQADYKENERNFVETIDKKAIFIQQKYDKLPKGLENTNQIVEIDGKDYIKIKVLKDVKIAWVSSMVLVAKIVNDEIEVIDTSNIDAIGYNDSLPKDYGGNSINRKAMIYDASKNELKDITEIKVKEEKEKIESIKKREEYKNKIAIINLIIIAGIFVYIIFSKKVKIIVSRKSK